MSNLQQNAGLITVLQMAQNLVLRTVSTKAYSERYSSRIIHITASSRNPVTIVVGMRRINLTAFSADHGKTKIENVVKRSPCVVIQGKYIFLVSETNETR